MMRVHNPHGSVWLLALVAILCEGCAGQIHDPEGAPLVESSSRAPAEDRVRQPASPPPGELDRARARERFVTTTDLVRYLRDM